MKTLAAFLIATTVSAQTLDRTKAPDTPPVPAVKIPGTLESKLPNGLTLVTVDDKRFPIFAVRLAFAAGYKYEPRDQPGLASALAALLVDGTKKRTSQQIAEEATATGGEVNATASSETLTIAGNALAEHLPKVLDLVSDVARNATFPIDEIKLYQQNTKQALRAQRSQPDFLLAEKFSSIVLGDSQLRDRKPTDAEIDAITAEKLGAYRDARLVPNNATLLIIGPIGSRPALVKQVTALFGDWKKATVPEVTLVTPPEAKKSITLVDRPGSVQANIAIGRTGLPRTGADYFPLTVGNTILGGGAASRLFNDIREKQGFAYNVYSFHQALKEAGFFQAGMQVRNEVVQPAIEAMLGHLTRMTKEPVQPTELTDAKNYIAGNFVIGLQSQGALAANLLTQRMNGLPANYLETFTTRIRSVEPDQIQKAAAKYMNPETSAVVVVGDSKAVKPALDKLGDVTVSK